MTRSRSLGARLLVATLTTAAIVFAALVGLVAARMSENLHQQAAEVTRWSEAQLSDALLGDAKLAAARLDLLREDVGRRFANVAKRRDVVEAVSSGNTVAVSELLRPALALADLHGAMAFDTALRAVSADRVDAPILTANAAIGQSPLGPLLRDLLRDNRPDAPSSLRRSFALDGTLRTSLAIAGRGEVVDVFAQPLFDEFGEVGGVLVAYRILGEREADLAAFAQLSGRHVVVARGTKVISATDGVTGPVEIGARPGSDLASLSGGRTVARCLDAEPGLTLCATTPVSELEQLAEKLVTIGEAHARSTLATLFVAALVALAAFTVVVSALSRQITRPLARVTEVVVEVAQGNWRAVVPGTTRGDEVGNIAQAVLVLESSLEERDCLREDVVRQNERLTRSEQDLLEQNARFDAALSNMSQGLCLFDAQGRLTVFNDRLLAIHRLAPGALRIGAPADEIGSRLAAPAFWPPREDALATRDRSRALADGRLVEVSLERMADGGWVETHEDVTETRRAQARIAHMAMYDALTDLPNRTLLAERLDLALQRWREAGEGFAVLCLDLDDFKGVNDTLGHGVGDDLLRAVALRLAALAPPSATVARLGGDEFVVLVPGSEEMFEVAGSFLKHLREPFHLSGHTVLTGASAGIAYCTDPDEEGERLLRRADLALYTAKAEGRDRCRAFDPALEERLHTRKWLEHELREALATQELRVHYQPLYDIRSGTIASFEALARWIHPERGPISPGDFIPLAEEVGLIDALGDYVLRQACADAVRWPLPVKVAVNISPAQFRNPRFCDVVAAVLVRTGLEPHRLELEVTESIVLGDDPDILGKLHRLRSLGIRFSMDDFGTGYSSLSSLRTFPFDKIKLDQSFVRDALTRDDCATIVRVVADLGRSLRMTTTAEGVETPEQFEHLRASGFPEAQGFLFSPAVPFEQAAEMLAGPAATGRAA